MGPCRLQGGVLRLALVKQSLQSEVALYTLLTRRQGLVCPKISVDDAMSDEGQPKSLALWTCESLYRQSDSHP